MIKKGWRRTIFATPLVTPCCRALARLWLRLGGWQVTGQPPRRAGFLLIGAPHTSNWDLFMALLGILHFGLDVRWLLKDSLFRGPLAPLLRWLGGLPVDRSHPSGQTGQLAQLFQDHPELVLVMAPEGTRSRVREWKTGFYHIARKAKVPIVLGYVDFSRRQVGMGPLLNLGEDLNAELERVRSFYRDKRGRRPWLSS